MEMDAGSISMCFSGVQNQGDIERLTCIISLYSHYRENDTISIGVAA